VIKQGIRRRGVSGRSGKSMGVKGLSGTDESRCIECRWNRG